MQFTRGGRLTVAGLLALVAAVGLTCGGLLHFARSFRGTEHWIMSASDDPGGMTILVGRASGRLPESIDEPDFTVVVHGFSPGRNIKPFAIDELNPKVLGLPIQSGLIDTTILPGRCMLQAGPVYLDVHRYELTANGTVCDPGGRIEIRVTPPPATP